MKIKVVVHEAEEGGYWAEVPAIPSCATQGDTLEELLANVHKRSRAACGLSPCKELLPC
jgi:predicted RNase H-like HicB family nuclease